MAKATGTIEVSVTELPHFRHLVDFLHAVEDLAQERDDTDSQSWSRTLEALSAAQAPPPPATGRTGEIATTKPASGECSSTATASSANCAAPQVSHSKHTTIHRPTADCCAGHVTGRRTRMPAKALVVGYGRMGAFHKKALEDLGFTVTTVDPAGHADHRTVPYWTWDAAAVATPVDQLATITRRLLLAGTPTLVEKPVARTLLQVKRLRITQLAAGTPCAVGFVERFNPTITALKGELSSQVTTATFTRINDRPSWDLDLDLRLHDVDLALYLGLDPAHCTFRTQAAADRKVRRIDTPEHSVDLTAHTRSPLHHLWRAFMRGDDYPTLTDAVNAHQALNNLTALPMAA